MEQTERESRMCWMAVAYAVAAVVLTGAAAFLTAPEVLPGLVPLLVFLALVVAAENAFVLLPSAASVSPSLLVIMASITALPASGRLVGAAVVSAGGGLVLDLFRRRRFAMVALNCAQFALAGLAAAIVFEVLRPVHQLPAVVGAAAVFAAVNVALILPAIVARYGITRGEVWADMTPALPNYLAFALLGTLVGELYSSLGWMAVALLMTPVLIARAAFLSYTRLRDAQDATINVFLRAIEAKDTYTARHTQRVCRYSLYIAEELGFSHTRLAQLRQAALMHDIGKLAVPKHLLNKPGKLTDEEFVRVQRHVHVCIDILGAVDFLRPMTSAAANHHARFDGGGYGTEGEHPLEAYIVAVADAYDAMTSTRAYRRALPMDVAFAELRAKSGTQFHPECVDGLIRAIERRGERHGLGYEEDVVDYDVAPPVAGVGSAGLGDRVAVEGA